MAAEPVGPAAYHCRSFTEWEVMAASATPSAEGLRCATCVHYVRLEHGVTWDVNGEVSCAHCAPHRTLYEPAAATGEEPRAAAAAAASATARRHHGLLDMRTAAQSDLASALQHLERLARRDPGRGQALQSGVAEQGLALVDVAARGVLCAYAEAEAFCDRFGGRDDAAEGAPALAGKVADAMMREWDAHVPSSLLVLLQQVADEETDQRVSLREELRRARTRCADGFGAQGFKVVDG